MPTTRYLTFTGGVQGNVLLNYDPSDPYITVGRICVALVIIFSYPLLAHACFGTVRIAPISVGNGAGWGVGERGLFPSGCV
jgi:hypothetical protein